MFVGTRRWSMATLFRILDLSAINAPTKNSRQPYLLESTIARFLVIPQIQHRYQNEHLPKELTFLIKRVLGPDKPDNVTEGI